MIAINNVSYCVQLKTVIGSFSTTYFSPLSAKTQMHPMLIAFYNGWGFAEMGLKYIVPNRSDVQHTLNAWADIWSVMMDPSYASMKSAYFSCTWIPFHK